MNNHIHSLSSSANTISSANTTMSSTPFDAAADLYPDPALALVRRHGTVNDLDASSSPLLLLHAFKRAREGEEREKGRRRHHSNEQEREGERESRERGREHAIALMQQ